MFLVYSKPLSGNQSNAPVQKPKRIVISKQPREHRGCFFGKSSVVERIRMKRKRARRIESPSPDIVMRRKSTAHAGVKFNCSGVLSTSTHAHRLGIVMLRLGMEALNVDRELRRQRLGFSFSFWKPFPSSHWTAGRELLRILLCGLVCASPETDLSSE
jgi:hypothetical protein